MFILLAKTDLQIKFINAQFYKENRLSPKQPLINKPLRYLLS